MAGQKPTVSQVLPSVRIIPRLTVSDDLGNRLTELALTAYRRSHRNADQEPLAVIIAPVKACSAAQFYVSEKEFETDLPTFRKALRDGELRKAINTLRDNLKSDALPPFAQMRSLFCYGNANSNGLEDVSSQEITQRQEREDLWDAKFSAARLEELLGQWQLLMDEIHRRTGAGRTPITAECTFVRALATYWTDELGCKVDGAGVSAYSAEAKQARDFVSFVRSAAEIIPEAYRQPTWDHAIRAVRSGEN
jgi:hypothetical protein